MKKNTVSVTFHSANNNGSFCQAYALQKVLIEKIGVNNKILDFRSFENQKLYRLFRPISSISDALRDIVSLLHYKKLNSRYNKFEQMRKKYLLLTDLYEGEDEAKNEINKYDIAICGSDQIWNVDAHDFSKLYFLPDVSCRKASYAVSCGSKVQNLNLEPFADYIRKFDALSLRETKSLESIQELTGRKDSVVSLDPTLLLDESDYDVLYKKEPLIKGQYIFLYTINYDKQAMAQAKRISKIYNMPVITVFTSYHAIVCHAYGIKLIYDAGPAEFLNLIKYADIVLTNSFHGTAFSVVFQKNFYHICSSENGQIVRDDRINGLLDFLGLHQSISLNSTDEEILNLKDVDHKRYLDKLLELRKESFEYLKKMLTL